jgi:adenosylcobinamide-phosphate synthase
MKFLSLLAALVIEQLRPLRQGNPVHRLFARYSMYLARQLDGGEYRHGLIAWLFAVLPPVMVALAVYLALHSVSVTAAWLWNVAVLYLTMGFRQFSHPFTEIMEALREARVDAAREELGRWRGEGAAALGDSEIARVAIEQALLATHRHVFGTIAWFLAAGAPGALLYRLAAALAERWGARSDAVTGSFGVFAERAFYWIDWLPARLSAAGFAIVGNFEDAVFCWRTQAASWPNEAQGVVLATAAGALGVRLGGVLRGPESVQFRPELGTGDEADVDYMRGAVGLVWRAVVLWMFVVLVVTIAYALG